MPSLRFSLISLSLLQVPGGLIAAQQITLDFDDPAVSGYHYCLEEGFHLKAAGRIAVAMQSGIVAFNGTRVVPVLSHLPPVTLSQMDGTRFTPLRVDLSEYSIAATPPGNAVPVEAVFGDGRVENHTFTLDGQIDGSQGPIEDFQTFTFPASWTGITALRFTVSGIALDNLVLQGPLVPEAPVPPLPNGIRDFQILAALPPNSTPWVAWTVHRVRGNEVVLAELSSRGNADRFLHVPSGAVSPLEGPAPNPWTGERAYYERVPVPGLDEQTTFAFWIYPDRADDENRVLLYQAPYPSPIREVNIMRAEHGKVAFVSHWYGGSEDYAVFIAQPGQLVPVVLPNTVLPDGGTPYHFPYQLYFEDQAVAFTSSTSLGPQEDCWFLQFPGKSLVLGFREGATLPGATQRVDAVGKLISLNRDRAIYYLKGATLDWLVETSREGIHRVLGATGAPPLDRPVAGCGLRCTSSVAMTCMDPVTGLTYYGGVARADERGLTEGVSLVESGARLLPVCVGTHAFPGLTAPQCLAADYTESGLSHSVIGDGSSRLLVRFASQPQHPVPRLGDIFQTAGGSRRVAAEYLTLGAPVTLETRNDLIGPWQPLLTITPGSISRSFPLPALSDIRGFFRLRYPE